MKEKEPSALMLVHFDNIRNNLTDLIGDFLDDEDELHEKMALAALEEYKACVLGNPAPKYSTEERPPTGAELEDMGLGKFSSTPHSVEYRGNRLKVDTMYHHTSPSFRVHSNSFPSVYFPGVKSPNDLAQLCRLVNGSEK